MLKDIMIPDIKDIIPDKDNDYKTHVIIKDKRGFIVASFIGGHILGQINSKHFRVTTRYDRQLKEKIVTLEE